MQETQITNPADISDLLALPQTGRIIALDIGTKKIGVAVCDEMQITTRRLDLIYRKSWKELLKTVANLITEYDAIAVVLGLPFNFDGTENEMSGDVRRLFKNFTLSLKTPFFLQDERLSSRTAQQQLYDKGFRDRKIRRSLDSEAAAVILGDFLELKNVQLKSRIKDSAAD